MGDPETEHLFTCPICMMGGSELCGTDSVHGAVIVEAASDSGPQQIAFISPCPRDARHCICLSCFQDALDKSRLCSCPMCRTNLNCPFCSKPLMGKLCTFNLPSLNESALTYAHFECGRKHIQACKARLDRIESGLVPITKTLAPTSAGAGANTPKLPLAFPTLIPSIPRTSATGTTRDGLLQAVLRMKTELQVSDMSIVNNRVWLITCMVLLSILSGMAAATEPNFTRRVLGDEVADAPQAMRMVYLANYTCKTGVLVSALGLMTAMFQHSMLRMHPFLASTLAGLLAAAEAMLAETS